MAKTITATGFEIPDVNAFGSPSGTSAPTISSAHPRTGTYALRCNGTAGQTSVLAMSTTTKGLNWTAGTRTSIRLGFYWVTFPGATFTFLDDGASPAMIVGVDASNQIRMTCGNGTVVTGPALVTGQYYVLEAELDFSNTGAWVIRWRVNNAVQTNATGTNAGTRSPAAMRFGNSGAVSAFDVHFDDFAISATAGDYPIGNGYGLGYKINASGTHSISTGVFKDDAGTTITAGETTSYTHLNETTPDTTTHVHQTTAASTNYIEYAFADTGGSADTPQCVAVRVYHQQAGSGVTSGTEKLHDFSTDTNITAPSSGAADYRQLSQTTRAGAQGAWTTAAIDALTIRDGFSASVAGSVPELSWAILEVDYATPYLFTSDVLSVSGSGQVTVSDSLHMGVAGALVVAGTGAVTISDSFHLVISDVLSVAGSGQVTLSDSLHIAISGLIVVAGNGQVTLIDTSHIAISGLLSVAGNGQVTILADNETVLSGLLAIVGNGQVTILDASHIAISGLLSVDGNGLVTIIDTLLIPGAVKSGPLNVTGSGDAELQVFLRVASGPLPGKPTVDASYVRNFSGYRHRRRL